MKEEIKWKLYFPHCACEVLCAFALLDVLSFTGLGLGLSFLQFVVGQPSKTFIWYEIGVVHIRGCKWKARWGIPEVLKYLIPCGLAFMWWGCCTTKLAHSLFYSILVSVSVFMALSTVFHSINPPDNLHFLTVFYWSYFCLISPFNDVSLYESLPQPWYNPLWLTGLKVPTN